MTLDNVNGKTAENMTEPVLITEPVSMTGEVLPEVTAPQTCVLLVEDESLIAEIIGEALEEHGFAVHSVANASDALAHLANGSHVDVLFTDINLPGELDGVGLADRVRGLHPDLPVIYASGRWGRLEELRTRPLSTILQKPYSPARACAAVDTLVAKRSAAVTAKQVSQVALAV